MEVQRIWINLGGKWIIWPREALYGIVEVAGGRTADDTWHDGLLKSQGNDFPFSILGAVRALLALPGSIDKIDLGLLPGAICLFRCGSQCAEGGF
jgi:hypothetical protein